MNSDNLPQLVAALQNDDPQRRAAAAESLSRLERLPVDAIIALVDATQDPDESVVEWACAALEALDPTDADLLCPPLVHRLKSGRQQGYWSATLLGRMSVGRNDPLVVEALLQLIEDGSADMSVQERAAWALGELGRPSDGDGRWESVLRSVAGSSNPRLARLAQRALG